MKPINFLIALLVCTELLFAQKEPVFKNYQWEENPTYSIDNNLEVPMLALKEKTVTEFYFIEENVLVEYFLEHRVLWLNSDDKIEEYNKIYLPYSSTSELLVNRARVITKEGKIVELGDSKILTAQDDETGRQYKYFAFEGIEKGSFIEYYYVVKRVPNYSGQKVNLQANFEKRNVQFDVFAPSNLMFKFKSYNGLTDLEQDTTTTEKLHWKLHLDTMPSLENEEVSAYHASKQYIIYKLDRNLANNANNITSYSTVAKNIYSYYYTEYSKSEQKLIDKFIKEAIPNTKADEETLIRNLENYIKMNYFISDGSGEEFSNLETILKQKVTNESGILNVYISAFRTLGIAHEIVLTSNRADLKFDKSFEANIFLTDYLLYFPDKQTYVSPMEIDSRYAYPPAYLTDNYGLFIKEVSVGSYKSGIGKISYIDPVKAEKTTDNMIIDVAFEAENLTNNIIKLNRSISGYYAMNIHPFINLIKQEDKDNMIESFAKSMNEDIVITDKKLVNDDPNLFGIKPLQFIVDLTSEAFVEKAGNKYLFKVGELIGTQMQMYQDKERKLPVENEFERSYFRTINVTIPEGYKVINLDDININNSYSQNGKELLSFKSFYELEGNLLKITADEHYRMNILDVPQYEDYRKVINSAADFNKIMLVLEPM